MVWKYEETVSSKSLQSLKVTYQKSGNEKAENKTR